MGDALVVMSTRRAGDMTMGGMPATRVSARRRTARLFVGRGLPLIGAGAAYLFGVRDWLGARTTAAEWMAGQIATAAPGVA